MTLGISTTIQLTTDEHQPATVSIRNIIAVYTSPEAGGTTTILTDSGQWLHVLEPYETVCRSVWPNWKQRRASAA